jgi:hypothetical protein
MSLLEPTPGEILDRISIVRLKISACVQKGISYHSLYRELNKLSERLAIHENWTEEHSLSVNLAEVNAELWACEDEIRADEDVVKVAVTAKKICLLNDERNRLVREINELFGINTVEEKLYGKQDEKT